MFCVVLNMFVINKTMFFFLKKHVFSTIATGLWAPRKFFILDWELFKTNSPGSSDPGGQD
jgi:hypothetical protein